MGFFSSSSSASSDGADVVTGGATVAVQPLGPHSVVKTRVLPGHGLPARSARAPAGTRSSYLVSSSRGPGMLISTRPARAQ